jgi:hypothetical protein
MKANVFMHLIPEIAADWAVIDIMLNHDPTFEASRYQQAMENVKCTVNRKFSMLTVLGAALDLIRSSEPPHSFLSTTQFNLSSLKSQGGISMKRLR